MTRLSAIARTALVAVLVVFIVVAAGAGYLASSSRTVISTSTTCVENGAGTIGLTALNASDEPIAGLPVQIKSTECGNPFNSTSTTDANGNGVRLWIRRVLFCGILQQDYFHCEC